MRESVFNKVVGLWPTTLLKKRLWHRCFPVNFSQFLRTPFLRNTAFDDCFWITIINIVIVNDTHMEELTLY